MSEVVEKTVAYKNLVMALGFLPRLIFNPWYMGSGKFGAIVRQGLAKPTKPFYFRAPPPWYRNFSALSPRQKEIVRRFTEVSRATAGKPLIERIKSIKSAFGR